MNNIQKTCTHQIFTPNSAKQSSSRVYTTNNGKKIIERRKHKRFWAQGGTFAVLRPHFYKRGQIVDVCKGGLAFCYTTSVEEPYEPFDLGTSLDIFSPEYHTSGANVSFSFGGLPIKIISDVEIAKIPFGSIAQRRCGVQFDKLTLDHKSEIDFFIQKYNIGGIKGRC